MAQGTSPSPGITIQSSEVVTPGTFISCRIYLIYLQQAIFARYIARNIFPRS